ncbi:HD-domain/PDEase-like protein [Coprinopsis marcescibilis]|uniref:HD-domain/PDEase-like protein n=1 Tax=Coprinopsis marcescibilis TaxID=230819 RepID=A0A5C3KVH5_COPMA|nr:HD-domain/PDEase-like protein [Coprinopsis marcescibilis]
MDVQKNIAESPSMSRSTSSYTVTDSDREAFFSPEPVRHIKDIIYDLIPVTHYLSQFIDTKPFQRLRNVKQLGTTCYVWPGASHSRFEHSLGVAYLSRCLASHLQSSQPSLGITNRDVACVEIAGLCHDLGHGPWSHVWDGMFMPVAMKDTKWSHEEGSAMMFDYIIENYPSILLSEDDVSFVKALILGEPNKCSQEEKAFLFEIVANKLNGIDVDKFDYIQRDSRMLGEPISISLTRILNSARVVNGEISYNVKDAMSIQNIFQQRFALHKRFYNHKTAKAIEYMIVDALISAEPYLSIANRVFDPKRFLHLSDVIMNTIEESDAPALEKAREIFSRIRDRNLYKLVDYKVVDFDIAREWKQLVTKEAIFEKAKLICHNAANSESLSVDDIIVDFSMMHHGMKEKNPMDKVRFYSKRNPDVSEPADPSVYSGLSPYAHAETTVGIYTKNANVYGLVQAGFCAVLREIGDRGKELPSLTPSIDSINTHLPNRKGSMDSQASVTPTEPSTPTTGFQPLPQTPGAESTTQTKRTFGRAQSRESIFTPNPFTKVDPSYIPPSPRNGNGKPVSKRRSGATLGLPIDVAKKEPLAAGTLDGEIGLRRLKRGRDEGENVEVQDKRRKA